MSAQGTSGEESVQLSAADARELARLLRLLLKDELPGAEQTLLLNKTGPWNEPEARAALVAKADALFSERKRRSQHFNPVMFGEPAWDMLLALYITDFSHGRLSIGRLVGWIGEPQTTALRWIDYLEKERLISRSTDPRDRRAVMIEITDKARQKLDAYLSTLPLTPAG